MGEAEGLQIDARRPRVGALAEPVHELCHGADRLPALQLPWRLTDRVGPSTDLCVVAPAAEHECRRQPDVTGVATGVAAGLPNAIELLGRRRNRVRERDVELVGETSGQ